MLRTPHRLLLALSALLLLAAFVFPLWRISLVAPQYPEGLGMLIRVNTVTGVEPHHLENINGLNHYIGMKRIVPDAIPELRIMPWALGALLLTGLGVAALGNRRLARAWTVLFLVGSIAGVADFWRWQYDYGHNLDWENAPIKIPGMSYQPPLIGSKQLLNFTATSWPGLGGLAAFASLGLAIGVLVHDGRTRTRRAVALGLTLAVATACDGGTPRALVEGQDSCDYCRMSISDVRFGAQLITSTGKVHTFDSIECLAGFASSLPATTSVSGIYVTDFREAGSFIPADEAIFLADGRIESPMGRRLVAFSAASGSDALIATYGGVLKTWDEVKQLVASDSSAHSPPLDHTHEPASQ